MLNILRNPFCKLHYDLFSTFGHVPGISTCFRVFAIMCVTVFLVSGVICQVVKLFSSNFNIFVISDTTPIISMLVGTLLYLPIGYYNRKEYRALVNMVEYDDRQKRTDEEVRIKDTYDRYAMLMVTGFTLITMVGSVVMLTPALLPPFLDLLAPMNASRPRTLVFVGEHFVDEEKYFYEILLYQYVNIVLLLATIGSVELMYFTFVIHTCAMYMILGCKLKNMTEVKGDGKGEEVPSDAMVFFNVGQFVKAHRRVLKFVAIMNTCADRMVIFLLGTTLLAISMGLVQLLNPKGVMLISIEVGQFFVTCFMGQILTNMSEKLPANAYSAGWYHCSARVQRVFVLLLMRTYKPCTITAYNLYTLSLRNFSAIIQTAVSYGMVLKQVE